MRHKEREPEERNPDDEDRKLKAKQRGLRESLACDTSAEDKSTFKKTRTERRGFFRLP